jgi:hypothetical protein
MNQNNIIYIIVVLFHILFINNNFGQLYLNLNAGIHALKIEGIRSTNPVFFIHSNNNYSDNLSGIVGVNLKYKFKRNIFCSVLASYTKKDVEASDRTFLPTDRFTFNYFQYGSGLGVYFRGFEFSLACEYNQLKQINKYRKGEFANKLNRDINELALLYRLSYQIRKVQMSLNYHNGIKFSDNEVSAYYFKPLKSISLDIGYTLKIKKLNLKKNDTDCPKL